MEMYDITKENNTLQSDDNKGYLDNETHHNSEYNRCGREAEELKNGRHTDTTYDRELEHVAHDNIEATLTFSTQEQDKLHGTWSRLKAFAKMRHKQILRGVKLLLFLGYLVYFAFALAYHIGNEESWRLVGCTAFGVLLITWRLFQRTEGYKIWSNVSDNCLACYSKGKRGFAVRG